MTLRDNIALALTSIKGNFLRTVLTLLIIAFGIMALVGILTAADGIKASLESNFATMGSNNFTIRKGGSGIHVHRRGRSAKKDYKDLELDQAFDFKERYVYPSTISISNTVSMGSTLKYEFEKTNPTIRLIGGDENYLAVTGYDVEHGRNFSEMDTGSGRNVVLLGNDAAKKLFSRTEKAVDKIISVNNRKYKVVGVLAPKGSSSIFSSDNVAIIPLLNAKAIYGSDRKSYAITISVNDAYGLDAAVSEATGLMRNIRKLRFNEEDDFSISKSDMLSSMLVEQSGYVTAAATLIGLITLLGGAIGLMNIMLVSVTERTREIGISKAVGAKRSTILAQFLVEAITICQIGGLLGIVLGIAAGNGVSMLLGGPFIIPWKWILSGLFLCVVVGLVSGIYPAMKASKVDPIESLRYE